MRTTGRELEGRITGTGSSITVRNSPGTDKNVLRSEAVLSLGRNEERCRLVDSPVSDLSAG